MIASTHTEQYKQDETITMTSSSENQFQSDESLRLQSENDSFTSTSDLEDEDEDEEYLEEVGVLISGLELLFRDRSLSGSFKTDDADFGDGTSSSSMTSLEVDSLVLTRERLPHLRHRRPMNAVLEADQSPEIIMEDYEVPLDMPLSGATKRKPESSEDTDTTFSDDEWDSLTVDSLILTRRRFAGKKRNKPRRVDSLTLTRRRNKFGKGGQSKGVGGLGEFQKQVKGHHVHYNTKLHDVISDSTPNTGGFNCAAQEIWAEDAMQDLTIS